MEIEIKQLAEEHIQQILPDIRQQDIFECEKITGLPMREIFVHACNTTEAYSGWVDGKIYALFGVNCLDGRALLWMVATDDFSKVACNKQVLRLANQYVRMFIERYGKLSNAVYSQNKKAVRFLSYLGAQFDNSFIINDALFQWFFLEGGG